MPTAISMTIGVSQAMPVPSGALLALKPVHTIAPLRRKVHSREKNGAWAPRDRLQHAFRAMAPLRSRARNRRFGRAAEVNIGCSKPLVGHGIFGTNRAALELDAS